ncbi:AMP-binding protein [Actinoplanes sp. NEAU-A12]|uniref:AMP-binding protein n=1 Tax=Actinoplanes sandaracinus TaxID=3045177 RepID=A0ABT6WZK1_9ACTN|nr:AMP-binding protein [Actinoplanes sandaracinus]MDI6105173.1 AMP-binding protein [Actinoplanes sandaracinus]
MPQQLLTLGFTAPEIVDKAWTVRWESAPADAEEMVRQTVPATVEFQTSGSTGEQQRWQRYRENVWLEAGLLADLVRPERPQAVVSFVPPAHLYGALATVFVPAQLGVRVWYRPTFFGTLPALAGRRVVVAATPWIFRLLLEHLPWVRSLEHLTVLHSSAMLPATAGEFLAAAGPDRALVVDVMGSTEAGGVALRRWRDGAEPPPWTLFPDVSFAGGEVAVDEDGEVPLVVRSPRLAFRPGGIPPAVWATDDHVAPVDDRSFSFAGRRNRLVKVNGRRFNLDALEHQLRGVLDCPDLALVPVADRMIGEHVDLLLELAPGGRLADVDLAAAYARIGLRPRRVHVVPRIDRSETGKLRHVQTSMPTEVEVAS